MSVLELFSLKKECSEKMTRRSTRIMLLIVLSLFSSHVNTIEACFTTPSKMFATAPVIRKAESKSCRNGMKTALTMYLPSSAPLSTKSLISDKRTTTTTTTSFKKDSNTSGEAWQYGSSNSRRGGAASVIASSDVLPSFRPAHGLLHPHTVMRLEEAASSSRIRRSAAVDRFIETYKEVGPMACLPILSDPEVLPELTKAMRGIAEY